MSAVHRPADLAELWPLLARGATVLAGGTDLLVRLRKTGHPLPELACLERIACLGRIEESDGVIRLGATATHTTLLAHPLAAARLPVLATALARLGSPLVRNMGTLGGNIVTASPAADTLPPLYALGAQVELACADGVRLLPLAGFVTAPGKTALAPGEILSAVLVPAPPADALQHFEKVGLRSALAISVVSLAAVIKRDDDGLVTSARLAVGSAAPTVVRCPLTEAFLNGKPLDQPTLAAAATLLRQEIHPVDDLRATAAYRRAVAGNLLTRLAGIT